jgi:S1-C subfamily serine protease
MRVDQGRLAGRAGLKDGMLIQEVNGTPITDVVEFAEAMEEASLSEGISLKVLTRSGSRSITLKTD